MHWFKFSGQNFVHKYSQLSFFAFFLADKRLKLRVISLQGSPQLLPFGKDLSNGGVKKEVTVNDIIKLVEDLTRIH